MKKEYPRYKKAFTLIELMVVVGIISILIAILLPSLARAREASKGVQCLSNLRQIGIAYYTYATDQNGVGLFGPRVGVPTRYWNHALDPTAPGGPIVHRGILTPYLVTQEVEICPSAVGVLNHQPGSPPIWTNAIVRAESISYLANPNDRAWHGQVFYQRLDEIEVPSDTVGLYDAARPSPANGLVVRFSNSGLGDRPLVGSNINATFHGRHLGSGSVVWYDGHASLRQPYVPQTATGLVNPAVLDVLKETRLGILVPVDPDTPQADVVGNSDVDYYFWYRKSIRR